MSEAGESHSAFLAVFEAVEASEVVAPELAARALAELRDGVITGEGPTAAGRIHFSRSLDSQDAYYCARILMAPSFGRNLPVTRAEADALLGIDAAASERLDGGRFDDLLIKAVTHHALASAGRPVPPRGVALDAATPLESWASPDAAKLVDAEVRDWLAGHMRARRRSSRALTMVAALLIGNAAISALQQLSTLVDYLA